MHRLIDRIGLKFDNNLVRDEQIRRVIAHDHPFKPHLYLRLKVDLDATRLQFDLHGSLINSLQKTITKHVMNFESRTNELFGYWLKRKIRGRLYLCFICENLWLK